MQSDVHYEWDFRKAEQNFRKHGVLFDSVRRMNWNSVLEFPDPRIKTEVRMVSWGLIGRRLHVLVYTKRGKRYRVISLRKANSREIKRYAKAKTHSSDR